MTCPCRHRGEAELWWLQPIRYLVARTGWVVGTMPRSLQPREISSSYCKIDWLGVGAYLDFAENLAVPGFDPRTDYTIPATSVYTVYCHIPEK